MTPGMRGCCIALSTSLLSACSPSEPVERSEPAPNIVLILADDLGYGDVGVYSPDSKIPTPRIDQLAREGVQLLDAHSPAPICSPSRYGVLTGREPWRETHVKHSLQPLSPPVLKDTTPTLPGLLAEAGYTTALVGKWHLGRRYTLRPNHNKQQFISIDWSQPLTDGPLQHGFERFFGLARPGWTFMEDGVPLAPPSEEFDLGDVPEEIYGKRAGRGQRAPGFRYEQVLPRYTQWTVEFIEREAKRGKPFFLEFAPATPHTPIAPSPPFQGKTSVGAYGDIVLELDDSVGRILDALERSGVADETLVVFTSDNGPETHAYERLQRHGHASMGRLRGAKHSVFEGGHRVPFIARWPGHIPANTTSEETISLVDLMATFAAAAGIALPADAAVDSHDVLPALLGQPAAPAIREAVFHSRGRRVDVRRGAWVLLESGGGGRLEPRWFHEQRQIVPDKRGVVALFDLATDLGQRHNVATQHPERVDALRALRKRATASERTAALPR